MANFKDHHHVVEEYLTSRFQNLDTQFQTMEAVIVLDGICGIGKTTDIKSHILKLVEKRPDNNVIYVSLYKSELHRMAGTEIDDESDITQDSVVNTNDLADGEDTDLFVGFEHPKRGQGYRSKLESLKYLIKQNKNVVITHKLLSMFDLEVLELLQKRSYHLIIDEDPTLIEPAGNIYTAKLGNGSTIYTLGAGEVKYLFDNKNLIADHTGKVSWKGDLMRYYDLKHDADNNKLRVYTQKENHVGVGIKQEVLMWVQNPDVFRSFKSVHLLTYLFKGSLTQGYFDAFKIPYMVRNKTRDYSLDRQYNAITKKHEDRIMPVHKLIELVHEYKWVPKVMTPYGGEHDPFSVGWYDSFKSQHPNQVDIIKKTLENYFKRNVKWLGTPSPAEEKMWSTYKSHKSLCQGKGYTKEFQSYNLRATNELRHKRNLAYMVNPYPMPQLSHFLAKNQAGFSKDQWATSVLIQWIFRSALRDGRKIKLYLPSQRMHELLTKWMREYQELYEFPREVVEMNHSVTPNSKSSRNITPQDFLANIQPGLKWLPDIKQILDSYT